MKTGIAGAQWSAKPGQIVSDLPDDECIRLIDAGLAEPVKEPREKAVKLDGKKEKSVK